MIVNRTRGKRARLEIQDALQEDKENISLLSPLNPGERFVLSTESLSAMRKKMKVGFAEGAKIKKLKSKYFLQTNSVLLD